MPFIPALLAIALVAAPTDGGDRASVARGQDRFDRVESVEELRTLEAEVERVVREVRPAVVLLRTQGGGEGPSSGTGVVISADGLVATCGHVGGRSGRRVEAVLPDGTVLRGRALGQANDGPLDCGLLQLDTQGRMLDAVPLGTSSGLAQGDWLVALGYTQGPPDEQRPALVRVGRVLHASPREVLFDAPIDAGDSGGPSFNLRGEVVALNARCGHQPWENAATPVDRLRERIWEFRDGHDETAMVLPFTRSDEPVRTRFVSGTSPDGRLAVQRSAPLRPVADAALRSMFRVMRNGGAVAVATRIDDAGHAVAKASLLPDRSVGAAVALQDAAGVDATAYVVGIDPRLDLAVLAIDGGPATGVELAWNGAVEPGAVLLSPRFGPNGPALGFAAIEERESDREPWGGPYLGVRSEPLEPADARELGLKVGLRVDEVVPGSAAAEAGVRVGDVIASIDGRPLGGRTALRRAILQREIGDRVELGIIREGERLQVAATLARREDAPGARPARRGNTTTPISEVSTGFGRVLAHDANVWPEQVGGPVLDLDGHVVGINIARFDRTATHALPAATVRDAVRRLLQRRELTPPAGVPAAKGSLPNAEAP
jgi:S1-C subfamily serine protease